MIELSKLKILTFANGRYLISRELLKTHLNKLGVDNLIFKTDEDLPSDFKETYNYLFGFGRGYGYWIWKPYFILQELMKLKDDEVLMYIDSSDVPEKKFFDFIRQILENQINLFVNRGFNHGQWTKMDCFYYMGCDDEKYYNATQLEAGLLCLKNKPENIELVTEWFENCKDMRKITDIQNQGPKLNLPNFIDHRHDQSILTNIIIKKGIVSYHLDDSFIRYNYNQ